MAAPTSCRSLRIALLFLAVLGTRVSVAGESEESAELSLDAPAPVTTISELLRTILIDALEDEYVDDRHWGQTTERFDGLRFRGLRISRRQREVNHGIWQRYRVTLIKPEKTFRLELTQGDLREDGSLPYTIRIQLRARCESTLAVWTWGVKGWNGTAVADATLQMKIVLTADPKIKFSLKSPLPEFDLRPRVEDVTLRLMDLDLRQVGAFDGKLVELIGKGSRDAVAGLVRQQEPKVRSRLQSQLEKVRTKSE